MAVCTNGHNSVTDDSCDACGTRTASSPVRVVGRHHAGGPRPAGTPDDRCPWCGNPSSSQVCDRCGSRVRRPFAPLTELSLEREPSPEPEPASEPERSIEPERSLALESSREPAAAPAWSTVTSWSAAPAPPPASKPPESLFPPLPQPG